jgi:UDP-N-acetylglucosamine diphosphorylase/glucosamine-1-phosphate N-acetyltransferase
MRLCLVEDSGVARLEPLTLTRPVYDLLLGASTLGTKIARAFEVGLGPNRRSAVVRTHLEAVQQERDPHTVLNDRDWLGKGPVVAVNARWAPPAGFEALGETMTPSVGLCEGRPAFAFVGPDDSIDLGPANVDSWFESMFSKHGGHEVGGDWIERPWDLVAKNGAYLERDFAASGRVGLTNRHLSTVSLVGASDRLFVHETARIDPYTVLDTTNGPITIGPGVWIQPFTRVEGPCFIGAESQLFRANLRGGVSIGPNCRIGGEVEASIVIGHSNKYHEGFLGHAYVGEWVNLGAITSNSDLRNDYGEVQVPLQGDPISTGMTKVGCFIGDHSRTGLGAMLNTGTSIGTMCNVLPAGILLPKHVPSFSAVLYGRVAPGFPLEEMFETARIVTGRRGKVFSEAEEGFYRQLFDRTRLERERAFHRVHDQRSDRWPVRTFSAERGFGG